jgi:hypothetical protein
MGFSPTPHQSDVAQEQAGIHDRLFCGVGIFRIGKAKVFHDLFDSVHRIDRAPASHICFVDDLQQVAFDCLLAGEMAIRVAYSISCCFNRHDTLLKEKTLPVAKLFQPLGRQSDLSTAALVLSFQALLSAAMRSTTLSLPPTGASSAEANMPYDEVLELEDINSEFAQADVAYVIGANHVTNPAARDNKTSPIYGMPILDVDKAKTCLFVKRSIGSGYAGIDNTLFHKGGTMTLLGDAKKMTDDIVTAMNH